MSMNPFVLEFGVDYGLPSAFERLFRPAEVLSCNEATRMKPLQYTLRLLRVGQRK